MSDKATLIIALWGAIVATGVLLWDIYKWYTGGVKVSFTAQPNMHYSNDIHGAPLITLRVANQENVPTTIENITAQYYSNYFYTLLRRPKQSMVIVPSEISGPIPYHLKAGSIWDGHIKQLPEMETMAKDGFLYFQLHCSHKRKPIRQRIIIKELTATKEAQEDEP
jgi:hypothetical protein